MNDDPFAADPDIDAAHRQLVDEGILTPADDEDLWADCDLASFAENRLGEVVDPRKLDAARRVDWIARATDEPLWPPAARKHERCYWLLDDGRPAGTIAIATSTLFANLVRLSSIYVFPDLRRRGIAGRALDRIERCLPPASGIRLETCWTWQATLRFYLQAGFWVRGWKRDIDLWRAADLPTAHIDIADAHATLRVDGTPLVHAERHEDRLTRYDFTANEPFVLDARSTLAVVLALSGWPLLSSPQSWQPGWHGDAGNPEGLADRILRWQAHARRQHWRVDTPRIPGLPG